MTAFGKIKLINWFIELNFFFAILGLPIFYMVTTYTGEIKLLWDILEIKDEYTKMWHLIYIVISGVSGILITVSVLLVCTTSAPIFVNITGKI